MKYSNVMIDIETMGHTSNAAIMSIAAIRFDPHTGDTGAAIYNRVDLQSSLDVGLEVSASTIVWWLSQKGKARKELINRDQTTPLRSALRNLAVLINIEDHIWAKSPSFDCVILKNAYRKCGIHEPWEYRNERDVRTIVNAVPSSEKIPEKQPTHIPLDDCLNQIELVSKAYKRIHKNRKTQ